MYVCYRHGNNKFLRNSPRKKNKKTNKKNQKKGGRGSSIHNSDVFVFYSLHKLVTAHLLCKKKKRYCIVCTHNFIRNFSGYFFFASWKGPRSCECKHWLTKCNFTKNKLRHVNKWMMMSYWFEFKILKLNTLLIFIPTKKIPSVKTYRIFSSSNKSDY